MSHDMVAPIGRAHTDPMEQFRAQQQAPVDTSALDAALADPARQVVGGAMVSLKATEPAAPSAMNLQSLAGQFSEGLQHGFYTADIDRLMDKLVQARDPSSGVTFGDVTVELLNVQAKVGIADAFSKVSTKLAEGLQTMVVKQG